MNPENIRELVKALEPLAAKVGAAGETVFGWAVRQVYADVVAMGAWAVACAVVATFLWRVGGKYRKKYAAHEDAEVPMVFAYAGSFVTGAVAPILVTLCILRVVNPDWYALEYVLGMVGR